jgi:glutamate-1-semialdehyde 2,1-aminomutase
VSLNEPSRGDSPIPGDIVAGTTVAPEDREFTIDGGRGVYVTDTRGTEYLDYKLGSGPMIVGHAHPEVVAAVQSRVEEGTTFYAPNQLAHDFAERIVDAVPCAESLKFVSTGTEATYLAMRLMRAHTGRDKILTFEGSYHGWHDHALVGSQRGGDRIAGPETTVDTAGAAPGARDGIVKAPFNDLARTAEVVEDHADDLAGVFTEPMMRSVTPADGFLAGLRELCDEFGLVLGFDEVVTGFRLAWGGAQEHYGVEPDLATYGKIIGGGTPVGAVAGRRSILEAMHPDVPHPEGGVETGGTLNGNPLGMAAGMATLDILDREDVYDDLYAYGDRLQRLFADVLDDSPFPGMAIGEGPVVDYAITDADALTDWETALACDGETKTAIDRALFDQGILKSTGGKMYLSTEHGDEEFERTAEAFETAVERAAENRSG